MADADYINSLIKHGTLPIGLMLIFSYLIFW